MLFYQIGVVLVVFLVVGLTLWQGIKQSQLNQLKKTNPAPVFQRKIAFIEQQWQKRTVQLLRWESFLLALGLVLGICQISLIQEALQHQANRLAVVEAQTVQLKKRYFEAVTHIPISPYPAKGLGLTDYPWEALFTADKRNTTYEVETGLSQQLVPYFGLTTVVITSNQGTETLKVEVKGAYSEAKDRELFVENGQKFFENLKQIPQIQQFTLQLDASGKQVKEAIQQTYTREGKD